DFPHPAVGRVAWHPFEHQRDRPIGQWTIDDIAVTRYPAHISGTPIDLTIVIVEYVLMGHAGIGQVDPRGMLQPLGSTGGTGRVEDEQRILCAHFLGRALLVLAIDQVVVPHIAAFLPGDIAAGTL